MTPIFNNQQEALNFYEQNGFVAIDGGIDSSYLSEMRKIMIDLVEVEKNMINKADYRDYGFLLCAPYYADKYPQILDILNNKNMTDFVEQILQKWFILYLYTNNCLPPNKHITKASGVHVDLPRNIPDFHQLVIAMITLDDYTEENGATWVLPVSQNEMERPTDDYFYSNAIRLEVPKGTICFLNPRMWHAAGINNSQDWRTCLLLAFCRPWMKQRVDIPRFMQHIDTKRLPTNIRQLLGFDCQPPANFKEFYGNEDERTFKQPFV